MRYQAALRPDRMPLRPVAGPLAKAGAVEPPVGHGKRLDLDRGLSSFFLQRIEEEQMSGERGTGVASAQDVAGRSGLDLLRAIIAGAAPAPPMGRTLGFALVQAEPGFALFEATPSEALLNPLGTVHGGWALALIDSAAGCAVHTELPAGTGYTTLETKVNFTRAIRPDSGPVRCEGRVVTRGRRVATAEARLLDGEGKVLAHGSSTLLILPPGG